MIFVSCMSEAIPENFVVQSHKNIQINALVVCSDISLRSSDMLGAGRSGPLCNDCLAYYLNGFTCALIPWLGTNNPFLYFSFP